MECIVRTVLGKRCLGCFFGTLYLMIKFYKYFRHPIKLYLLISELKIFMNQEKSLLNRDYKVLKIGGVKKQESIWKKIGTKIL